MLLQVRSRSVPFTAFITSAFSRTVKGEVMLLLMIVTMQSIGTLVHPRVVKYILSRIPNEDQLNLKINRLRSILDVFECFDRPVLLQCACVSLYFFSPMNLINCYLRLFILLVMVSSKPNEDQLSPSDHDLMEHHLSAQVFPLDFYSYGKKIIYFSYK